MKAHEWGGSAPPCGDQGTGTQGSPVGRRLRLVNVDREFRAADRPQVPDSGPVPRTTPTGRMASEQQAVPSLTSSALRGMPHHSAELDLRSRRSLLPVLGSTLPVSHSDLPVLHADQPGLRHDLHGSRGRRRAASRSIRAAVGNYLLRE